MRAIEEAEDRAGEIAREQELIQQYRHQRKHGKMHEHEAGSRRCSRSRNATRTLG
jgi:hypothetical protein